MSYVGCGSSDLILHNFSVLAYFLTAVLLLHSTETVLLLN